jgi:folate-binding protein YgfZ
MNEIPFHGSEITPNVHPFSCGLEHLVHPDKGCYIGQEILTRMRSRGKTGKVMVRKLNPVENPTTVGKTHSLCIERIQ